VAAPEKRYTVQTLELLHDQYPAAELIFVLGTDMYQDFETWRDYRRVFSLAHLAVVNRPGFPFRKDLAPYRELTANERVALPGSPTVFFLPHVLQPISSTAIRESRREGGDIGQWVPPAVWDYIERNELYLA
jgi:nicotinate-nucleotide adenylyltransferase